MDADRIVGYVLSLGGMLAAFVVPITVAIIARGKRNRDDPAPAVVQGQPVELPPPPVADERALDLLEDALQRADRLQRRLDKANARLGDLGEPPS